MQIWVPTGNQVSINEVRASNLQDMVFWDAYFAEEDIDVKSTMLEDFDSYNFTIPNRLLYDLDDDWEDYEENQYTDNIDDFDDDDIDSEVYFGDQELNRKSQSYMSNEERREL